MAKKRKTSLLSKPQKTALNTLLKALLETYEEKATELSDEFEEYTHILKCKAHLQRKDFNHHFISGYELLLKRLVKP